MMAEVCWSQSCEVVLKLNLTDDDFMQWVVALRQ